MSALESNKEEDLNFESDLFLNKSYVDRTFCFGDLKVRLKCSDSTCTDYDLTGQVIWPAAFVMCKYFQYIYEKDRTFFQNKSGLELGSGTGLMLQCYQLFCFFT